MGQLILPSGSKGRKSRRCKIEVYLLSLTLLFGYKQGMGRQSIKRYVEACILPVGLIVLIIGTGAAKQVLIESGVGALIGGMSESMRFFHSSLASWLPESCLRLL